MSQLTEIRKLLKYPHAAVFDLSPEPELVFRLNHPGRARWEVADRVLTLTANDQTYRYNLSEFSIGSLCDRLQLDGFTVLDKTDTRGSLSALVLIDGAGDEYASNGDHLYAFNSLLWVILSSYVGVLLAGKEDVRQALLQMFLTTAEGEWLDLWGTLYGVARKPSETDVQFRERLPREAFRIRCNAHGIEQAILDETGFDVRIHEPWQDVFTFDQSILSGPDKIYDGSRIGYHLIKPVASDNIDWPAVLAVINRNRAAGIEVLGPDINRSMQVDGTGHTVMFGWNRSRATRSAIQDRVLHDFSDFGDVSVLNYRLLHQRTILRYSASKIGPRSWEPLSWEYADHTWEGADYLASLVHSRKFRVTYMQVGYLSQYWQATELTWDARANETWEGLNPVVRMTFSRS